VNKSVKKKVAQTAPIKELYGLDDDYGYNPEVIDYDRLERGEIPAIREEDIGNYLVDDYEGDEIYYETIEEEPEVPIEVTDEELPEFGSTLDALNWAVENNKVVRINYVTKKGTDLTRIVEPHDVFIASGTGNLVVVTFDRSVRKIRAFIVNNILNYIFTGKEFKERLRILPKVNKRIKTMDNNIFKDLREIGDEFEKIGLVKNAKIITDIMDELLQIKTAQYVGAQGYWIRNRRCWDNCYRQKRTTEPDKAAQEVWMECWDEYKKSINNNESGWEKYASIEDKIDESNIKKWDGDFIKKASKRIDEGESVGPVIYSTIDEESQKNSNLLIKKANGLLDLSKILVENKQEELGDKVAKVSLAILKEGQSTYPFPGQKKSGGIP